MVFILFSRTLKEYFFILPHIRPFSVSALCLIVISTSTACPFRFNHIAVLPTGGTFAAGEVAASAFLRCELFSLLHFRKLGIFARMGVFYGFSALLVIICASA